MEKYRKWAEEGDNEFRPFVNYTVSKKKEGKLKLFCILLILAYAVVDILYAVVFFTIIKIPMMGALIPVLTWMMIFFTWRFVQIEYEYKIHGGEMTFRICYGEKSAKEMCKFKFADVVSFASLANTDKELLDLISIDKTYDCRSSKNKNDAYVAIFEDKSEKYAVYFEVDEKVLSVAKYYTPRITK